MLRPAEKRDASRLAEILIFAKRTAYRSIFNNDFISFNKMQVLDLALAFRDQEHILDNMYVYDDGIVKGLIKWGIETNTSHNCIRIHELYVDPFFQGQGIGAALIKNCIQQAKEHGIKHIVLWVLEENRPARFFYERHGFQYDEVYRLEDGTSVRALEYILKL